MNRIVQPHLCWDDHCETGNDEEHCRYSLQYKAAAEMRVFLDILGQGAEGRTRGSQHAHLVLHHLGELGAEHNDTNQQQNAWAYRR